MSFSIPIFRQKFPEFDDPMSYSNVAIGFWADTAATSLPESRWGGLLESGMQLYVAHHLVVARRNEVAANAGGLPGEAKGVVASKSVDKVSVSYDTKSVADEHAGWWNSTIYGMRFWQLAQMAGAGGLQL